jgi:small subunit ribosomal protein S8
MSVNYQLANFVCHVKNCIAVGLRDAQFMHTKLIESLVFILKDSGYIADYDIVSESGKKVIRVKLSYYKGIPSIRELDLISKPGKRVYIKKKDIKPYKNGIGLLIISTSHGLLSYYDAIKKNVGGEVLCSVF